MQHPLNLLWPVPSPRVLRQPFSGSCQIGDTGLTETLTHHYQLNILKKDRRHSFASRAESALPHHSNHLEYLQVATAVPATFQTKVVYSRFNPTRSNLSGVSMAPFASCPWRAKWYSLPPKSHLTKGLRKLFFVVCSLCLSASVALAQGKVDSQWNCGKPTDAHSIDVGDQTGHAYAIARFTCTAVKGELEGVKEKEGTGTEFEDVRGNSVKLHGVFVETLTNGDKIHISYQGTGATEKGQLQSGSDEWTITSGTGKLKGAKGKGDCKGKGNPDGSATFDCTGEYTLAK